MPVVAAVFGNHDHESGVPDEVRHILQAAGVQVLDGEAIELLGVGIAGAKGFAGEHRPRRRSAPRNAETSTAAGVP